MRCLLSFCPLVCCLLMVLAQRLDAVELIIWDSLVQRYRADAVGKGAMVYLGSAENRLARLIAGGQVALHGLQAAVLDAEKPAINPISDRPIPGLELFRLLAGTAGAIIFLDRDGMPLVQLSLPQIYHGNDVELLGLWAGYAAGRHYTSMTVSEYSRALGMEHLEEQADQRMQTNGFGLPIMPGEAVPTVVLPDGEPVQLRENPGVFFVVGYPGKPGFDQQLREIALAFRAFGPRIVAIIPHGTAIDQALQEELGALAVAHAGDHLFEQQATPRMLLFGQDGSGMSFFGFQPADVISKHTRVEVSNMVSRSPNLPYGETDTGVLPVMDPQEMVDRVDRHIQKQEGGLR